MRHAVVGLLITLCLLSHARAQDVAGDVESARAVFEKNLEAIRTRDRDAYLAVYLHAPTLARTGPEGFSLGFEEMERSAGQNWPTVFEASDLRLVPVQPGVVYGTYRYRVRYGKDEQSGLSERLFVRTDDGWKIAVTTAFQNLPGVPPPPRALTGAILIDGTGATPIRDSVVITRGGKIECAGSRAACPVPANIDVVNVRGLWLLPGLIDAHVHFSQSGWADGRPDALDVRDRYPYEATVAGLKADPHRFFDAYLCSGVTAVYDVGGYPWTLSMADENQQNTHAPVVAAAGPLLSTRDHWLNLPAERQFIYMKDEQSVMDGVKYLRSAGADAVKVWYIAEASRNPEELAALVMKAGEEASKAGLPLIVHATGLAEAKVAVRAGAHLLVHSVWDQTVDREMIDLLRAKSTIYCPTLTVSSGYQRMFEGVVEQQIPSIDDPNRCVDSRTRANVAQTARLSAPERLTRERLALEQPRDEDRARNSAENLKRVAAAGVTIAMGTDAGNPLTLHGPAIYAETRAMVAAGMSPMAVIVASTRGGSMAMKKEKEIGTVEKGKSADLLILGADPLADIRNLSQVRHVMRSGVLRGVEELRAPEK